MSVDDIKKIKISLENCDKNKTEFEANFEIVFFQNVFNWRGCSFATPGSQFRH